MELTASLDFLKIMSMSSSGFQSLGTPSSSYRNRPSNSSLSLTSMTDSAVCSSILARSANQARFRRRVRAFVFSSSVQLKPE
jgi:hypothetical protein